MNLENLNIFTTNFDINIYYYNFLLCQLLFNIHIYILPLLPALFKNFSRMSSIFLYDLKFK